MTALAYMRVSGASQADGDGFDRQRLAIERLAASKGITITGWFQDVQTGKDEWQDRPGWSAMVATLNGTRIVLVEKLDRIAREVLVQELIMRDLRKREVALLSSTGDDTGDENLERKMLRQMLSVFAEYERASIVLKLRGARQRKKEAGGRGEGRVPYGGVDKHGIARDGEAAVLSRIKSDAESGSSHRAIADHLNASGIATRYGRTWRASTIRRILA